eukprot:CAMPEP_0117434786 /NCGR_PEP_ID=MMETSP0759-20121206/131_1 /TAXON_ID=63605 /ORGANISM="Percolomonas cosmopolitus, Strain WS" /LENGTH=508 /DNA_ID=CAMNT_0005226285 /DNA_START=245 /DNA_END=1771 /DNA_ORIENTATION=-
MGNFRTRNYALSAKRERAAKLLRERFESFKGSEVAKEKREFAEREEQLRQKASSQDHVIHKDQEATRKRLVVTPSLDGVGGATTRQDAPEQVHSVESSQPSANTLEKTIELHNVIKQRIKEHEVPASREEARKFRREELSKTALRKDELLPLKDNRKVFVKKTVPILKSDPGLWRQNKKFKPEFISPTKAKFSEIYEDMDTVVHQPENPKLLKVSIIGNPNAGKSTFLNAILGEKVSAVSHKVCTTRNNILGLVTENDRQIMFFDTPGILQREDKRLYKKNEDIMGEAFASLYDADMAVMFIDATKDLSHINHLLSTLESFYLKYRFQSADNPILPRGIVAVVNKVDLITPKNRVGEIVDELQKSALFSRVFPLSARQGEGMDTFKQYLLSKARSGKWLFSKDKKTDMTREDRVIEVVREKLFTHVHSELPYDCKVELPHPVSYFEHKRTKEACASVGVLITCPSPAAVRVVVGQLKPLHSKSLRELETIIKRKVFLTFNVKLGRHVR